MTRRPSKSWHAYWSAKCDALAAKWDGINAAAKALGLEQWEYCERYPEKCR